MRSKLGCFIFIMIMMTSQIFAGNVYYVDATNGNDLNDGLSEVNAWKTISKVNAQSFSPGDIIKFKRGEIWREQLWKSSGAWSGSSGSPITFTTYSNGAKPIFYGSDLMTGWFEHDTNIWKKTSVTTEPYVVVFDGTWGEFETAKEDLDANYEWYYDSENDILYVYADGGDPDTQRPSGIDVGQRNYGFALQNSSYINIDNIDVKNVNTMMFTLYNANNIIVDNCDGAHSGRLGFNLNGTPITIFYQDTGIFMSIIKR